MTRLTLTSPRQDSFRPLVEAALDSESRVLERGAKRVAVQEQLDHSSLATTTKYAHVSNSSADYLIV